jgi:hypothetical protein
MSERSRAILNMPVDTERRLVAIFAALAAIDRKGDVLTHQPDAFAAMNRALRLGLTHGVHSNVQQRLSYQAVYS